MRLLVFEGTLGLIIGGGDASLTVFLERHGCWEPLWRVDAPPSGLEGMDPFGNGLSMTGLGG